jgi:hypothetical protein
MLLPQNIWMGVVVFTKVRGIAKSQSPRTLWPGSLDFKTLLVLGPLQKLLLPLIFCGKICNACLEGWRHTKQNQSFFYLLQIFEKRQFLPGCVRYNSNKSFADSQSYWPSFPKWLQLQITSRLHLLITSWFQGDQNLS